MFFLTNHLRTTLLAGSQKSESATGNFTSRDAEGFVHG
jgi:hypothetical protein